MADFWFGNLRKAGYYPAPNSDMKANAEGETDVMQFADGGAYVGQSDSTHKEFDMDWGVQERSVMNFLNEFRNGVNGSGLLYFADPFAVNVLPPHWARPELTCNGWPSLIEAGNRPAKLATAVRTNYAVNPKPLAAGTRITSGSTAATYADVAVANPVGNATVLRITTDATAGTRGIALSPSTVPTTAPVTVSAWVKVPAGQVVNMGLRVYPDASNVNTTANTSNYTGTGDWQRISATISAFASGTRVAFYLATGFVSSEYLVSSILIEQASAAGGDFDGSTVFVDGTKAQWTGAVDASTSTTTGSLVGLPDFGAQYTLTGAVGSVPTRRLTLLIPPDRDLVFGFSGSATGGAVLRARVATTNGAWAPWGDITLLDPTGTTRMNVRVKGSQYRAIQIYFAQTAVGSPKLFLVSGKAVYCLPTENPVLTGVHVEGEGHSGFRFGNTPAMSYIQAADGHRYVTTAANFVEVEAWL